MDTSEKIYSQNITSTCTALKQTTDFTTDLKPSLKKLKKMVDKVPKEEMLEYALYLNNFLKLQLAKIIHILEMQFQQI
jgi:hypothetical protein